MWEIERDRVNERNKRKGGSLVISTWPVRASVNKANAAIKCLFCRIVAPSGFQVGPRAEREAFNGVCLKPPDHNALNVQAKLFYGNLND